VLTRSRARAAHVLLEQSTRYIPYDSRLPSGHYRYHRDQAVLESPLGARYVGEMDRMFDTYAELLPALQSFVGRANPREEAFPSSPTTCSPGALSRRTEGLLPAGSLSNVGFWIRSELRAASLRMRAHPLPEARRYADLILIELRKVIPSFLSRIDRPNAVACDRVPRDLRPSHASCRARSVVG